MAVLFSCQSLTKSYGTQVLFEDLTFGMNDGENVGIVGPNGAGKSTFLKVLAGIESSDRGTLTFKRGLRLGYLEQESPFDRETTVESVLTEAMERDHEHLDAHEREARIDSVLNQVGFGDDMRGVTVGTLSGGWRKRVFFARELVRQPDLLLMDEPTNHLDLEGILWLEALLASAPFAVLMVSHDRVFLENTANRIVELNRCYPEGVFSAPGQYSDFIVKREEFMSGQMQTQQALESKVRREIEWLKRGAHGRTTKQKARIGEAGRLIDELAATKSRNTSSTVRIDFSSTNRQANKLLVLKNVSKALGGKNLFSGLNLTLTPGTRLGLLGPNGSGKTTLFRLFTGEIQPDEGQVIAAEKLRIVSFDQHREQIDKETTLRRALAPSGDTVTFRDRPEHVSGWAKRFLFKPEQLDMPVKNLSGGEQARILIARLMLRPADLLLLDEPTNDLDIPSLEVLEESLADFPGAVVLVTHDRFMVQRLSTEILGLDGKGHAEQYADYSQWENARDEALRAEAKARKNEAKAAPKKEGAKNSRGLTYKEQRELETMEENILAAEGTVEALHKQLESPEFTSDPKRLQQACTDLATAQAKVDGLYARWKELGEKQA